MSSLSQAGLLGLLLSLPVVSSADDAPFALDPVVVVASGQAESPDAVVADVVVMDRTRIERAQALDLAALLRELAGIDVARSGGPGQQTSVFLRGAESNHTLVLVDGVRVNPATAGGAALQNIDPVLIERVEVLRGPRSTLYGSDAIGGVINVVTRGADAPAAHLRLAAGSDALRAATGGLRLGSGGRYLALNASHDETDGFPSCASSSLDRGYRRTSAQLDAAATLGPVALRARGWHAQGRSDYLDFCSAAYGNQPLSQDFRNDTAQVEASGSPLPGWASGLRIVYGRDDIEQNEANYLGQYDQVRTERPELAWDNWVAVLDGTLALGLQWQRESVDALSYGSVIDDVRERRRGWLQHDGARGRLHWLGAVAVHDDDAFGTAHTWNAELGVDVVDGLQAILAGGSGYRAPDVTDLYGFGGNPDLDPERSKSVEAGLRWQASDRQRVELRAFHQRIDDLISVEYSPSNDPAVDFGYRAVNIDEARIDGAELRWTAQWRDFHLDASTAWTDARDAADDSRLLRRSKGSANVSITHAVEGRSVGFAFEARSERPDIDAETGAPVTDAGYGLLHLNVTQDVGAHWQLSARVENLFNRDYVSVAGYRAPGRIWRAGLRWTLG